MERFPFSEVNTSQWLGRQPHCGGLFTHSAVCPPSLLPASSGRPGSGGWPGEPAPRPHGRAERGVSEHRCSVDLASQLVRSSSPWLSFQPRHPPVSGAQWDSSLEPLELPQNEGVQGRRVGPSEASGGQRSAKMTRSLQQFSFIPWPFLQLSIRN